MRIALVYDAVFPYVKGGAERVFAEVADRLAPAHEVHLFGMKFWDGAATIRKKDNLWLHGVCPAVPLYSNGRRSLAQALWFTVWLPFTLMRWGRFDVIHSVSIPYFPVILLRTYSALAGSRFVTTWPEFFDNFWTHYLKRGAGAARRIERMALRCSPTIVANPGLTSARLAAAGVPAGSIMEIPPGIDWNGLQCIRPADEEADILFVGRLIQDKRVDLLLDAVSRLVARRPGVTCRIVGDGPERQRLEGQARRLGLEPHVSFLGALPRAEDVYGLMKAARVLVFPSEREGFGIVVLEAAACGLPAVVVESRANAAASLVAAGGFGSVCAPTAEDVADEAGRLLDNPELRNQLGNKGKAWARQYDWDRIAERTGALYQSLVATEEPAAQP